MAGYDSHGSKEMISTLFECDRCGAQFTTLELLRENQAAPCTGPDTRSELEGNRSIGNILMLKITD